MKRAVLDASVVLKWFAPRRERGAAAARRIRNDFESGRLVVVVPPILFLEVLNVAGRSWAWGEAQLLDLAADLDELSFDVGEANLAAVAPWVARGLTAYDAAYVALADARDAPMITADRTIVERAAPRARALA